MTDTTGDIYYSGQICRGSVALGTGCGKCEKCKAEAEVKEEQLYICDSIKNCKVGYCRWVNTQPEPFESCSCNLDAKSIPYTEEKEEEKSCETCRYENESACPDPRCVYPDLTAWEPKEEKEPKTKSLEVMLDGEEIPLDRLRYGTVKKGDIYLGFNSAGEVKVYTMSQNEGSPFRLIIDPPTKAETVEEVLKDMPMVEHFHWCDDGSRSDWYNDKCEILADALGEWQKRYKAAQERSK